MSASKARESVWTLVGALVAVAVLATIAIAATCWVFLHPPPSDADLIARFRAHRADFDAVAAAATPDSDLVSVSRDPGWGRLRVMRLPSGAGGGHRIGERARGDEGDLYGRPLRRIGASGVWRSPGGAIWIRVSTNYDVRKGFVNTKRAPAPLRASLDRTQDSVGNGYLRQAFVPLGSDWYLFVEARE